jgi:hypothetical protein
MFFSKLPNIEYDLKPIKFPISTKEYVLVNNFFRRFKLTDTAFKSAVYFNKYTILDGERPDIISEKFYGTTKYDWIVILTNNIINPLFEFPIAERSLYDFVAKNYSNPDGLHHYETIEVTNSLGEIVLKSGYVVDSEYVSLVHKFYDRGSGTVFTKNGSQIVVSISNYEYEKKLNDDRREIYILRPQFIDRFVSEFENKIEYDQSSAYINRNTKKTGI